MSRIRLNLRDLFYGVLIIAIALAAFLRSVAEKARTDAAERRTQQIIETYKEQEGRQAESSHHRSEQQSRFIWAWGELQHEANELRARLGEPKQIKGPDDYVP